MFLRAKARQHQLEEEGRKMWEEELKNSSYSLTRKLRCSTL